MRQKGYVVHDDPWLNRWQSLLNEHSGSRTVLELGCGTGRDTATLSRGIAGAVSASLSLHYFTWPETLKLSQRIRQTATWALNAGVCVRRVGWQCKIQLSYDC